MQTASQHDTLTDPMPDGHGERLEDAHEDRRPAVPLSLVEQSVPEDS